MHETHTQYTISDRGQLAIKEQSLSVIYTYHTETQYAVCLSACEMLDDNRTQTMMLIT